MANQKVLVVEDEKNVLRLMDVYLSREGYTVITASDGEQALQIFREQQPDLVVLDLMLPKIDGWDVCREIRRSARTPVIMLTARGDEMDRILGLELGADDYVTKPFSPKELVLRVKAVLRRTGVGVQDADGTLEFPGLNIDENRRRCLLDDQEIALTRKEFDLLWHLASHPGMAFSREQLLERVWGYDFVGEARTIDVHVTRLREKIEGKTGDQTRTGYRYLHTVWGIGYKFEVVADEPEPVR